MEMSAIIPSVDPHEVRTRATKHIAESSAPVARPESVCSSYKAAFTEVPSYNEDVPPPEVARNLSDVEGDAAPERKVTAEASVSIFDSSSESQARSGTGNSQRISRTSVEARSSRSGIAFIWSRWLRGYGSNERLPPGSNQDIWPVHNDHNDLGNYPSGPLVVSDPSLGTMEGAASQFSASQRSPSSSSGTFSGAYNPRQPDEQPRLESLPMQRAETMEHYAEINRRRSWSLTRKLARILSLFIAVLAVLEIVLVLTFSKSKVMTRAGFMGGILVFDAAVVTCMVTDKSTTKVEALMAATFIVVLGFWITSNLDTFFGYPS